MDAIPLAVRQLCAIGSAEWAEATDLLTTAFERIACEGIVVEVLFWPHDVLTPFPWRGDIRSVARFVHPTPVTPRDLAPPRNKTDAVFRHLAFIRSKEVLAHVAATVAALR